MPADRMYLSGLDLGQSQDFSALSVAEVTTKEEKKHYAIRHIQRWARGTPYPDIVNDTVNLFKKPPIYGSTLLVDRTGIGRAIVDMLSIAKITANVVPVTITSGFRTLSGHGVFSVPKSDLVGAMQVLLGTRRLQVANIPLRSELEKELRNFRIKITKEGNELFEADTDSLHDDLVLSICMICWWGERGSHNNTFKVVRRSKGSTPLRILLASSLDYLHDVDQLPTLVVVIQDPAEEPVEIVKTPIEKLLTLSTLTFANLEPKDFDHRWDLPLAPTQKLPEQLVYTKEHARTLWRLLASKYQGGEIPQVLYLVGKEQVILSLALALCDTLSLPRNEVLYKVDQEDWQAKDDTPIPNQYLYDLTKSSRHLIVGSVATRFGKPSSKKAAEVLKFPGRRWF